MWLTTTVRDRDGVVTQLPPRTKCVTQEMLKQSPASKGEDFGLPALLKNRFDISCKALDRKWSGPQLTWRIECTGLFPAEQTGRMTVENPQRYTQELKSSVKLPVKTLHSVLTVEARRIGECPK